MHKRAANPRLAVDGGPPFGYRLSTLMLVMFAALASIYVAGRLWQDAENRVYLIEELEKRTRQGQSAVSVEDTLEVIACREQQKMLSALQMELMEAGTKGSVSKYSAVQDGTHSKKKLLAIIGIITSFGCRRNRDAIRKAWMPTGVGLKKLEIEKGIVIRFVIGRSPNPGDSLDREVDIENRQNNDFMMLDDHVESPKENPKKAKLFFAQAAETWDAEFYAKVNDDVYVNIDGLAAILLGHLDNPHVYIGCMKSGEVFSELAHKWHEPDWWKFGDEKSYFRHASGEIFIISQALGQFISINRPVLGTYAHDDVSAGSWFIGLDVKHVNERKLCCSLSTGTVCAAV